MKIKIYLGMLSIVAMLASCSQNEDVLQTNSEKQPVTFTAQPDYGINTRAVTDDPSGIPSRAFMVVCEEGSEKEQKHDATTINADGSFSFTIELETTKKYNCYFWADGGDYNVENLGAITYADATDNTTKPSIAFSARLTDFTPSTTAASITLKHAVAKMVVNETKTLADGDVIGISFNRPNYSFNLKEGTYAEQAGSATPIALTHTATAEANSGALISAYMLAPQQEAMMVSGVTLSYTASGATDACTRQLDNVSFKANHRTVFTGHFPELDTQTRHSFTVSMNPDWEDNENMPIIGADKATHTIRTASVEQITTDMITEAVGQGKDLKIVGPMNAKDLATISTWVAGHADAALDLSTTTGLTEIPNAAFALTDGNNSYNLLNPGLASIKLPTSITRIGMRAFYGCYNLASINLSELTNLNSIGYHAFSSDIQGNSTGYRKGLQGTVEIPEGCSLELGTNQELPNDYFQFSGITEIVFPSTLTFTNTFRCYAMPELTTVTIKGPIEGFYPTCFSNSDKLTDIYLPNANTAPTAPGENAFTSTTIRGNVTVHVPAGCVDNYSGWTGFKDIVEITE